MREIRAESNYVLTLLTFLLQIEPFLSTFQSTVNIHTRSQGLINKVLERHINKPSIVISDHIDIIYQIREITSQLKIKVFFIHTNVAPKEIDEDTNVKQKTTKKHCTKKTTPVPPTEDKIIMRELLDKAAAYYHTETATPPSQHALLLPAQKICITYNRQPIVSQLANFLQESERRLIREEYFEARMGILPTALPHIDTYAIARVIQRGKPYKNAYSKIIHKSLNTMTVNQQWKLGDSLCPFCKNSKEDWKHIITCKNRVRNEMREKCIIDFELALQQHHTYPPLADFILEFITENTFDPEEPMVINPRYCLLFHNAFHRQKQVGWENFSRGLIVFDWKCIQYKYFLQKKTKDIHAVDKWTRMIIRN